MAITQAGRTFSAAEIKVTAGNVATAIRNAALDDGAAFRTQLESWPDADLVLMGLTQEEVNAIKGFYVGDLPAIAALLSQSVWIKQLLGTGV